MTSQNSEKTQEEMVEEIKELQRQNSVLMDLHNLKGQPYFRQQVMICLERISQAQERQALAMENLQNQEEGLETPSAEEPPQAPQPPKK